MFTNNSSPFSGLVPVILILVFIGAASALALSGSDLTNFLTNRAKAEAMIQQNDIDAKKAAIDLTNYEILKNSQAKVEQDKILADGTAYQKSVEQQLDFQQRQNEQNLQLQAQKAARDLDISSTVRIVLAGSGAIVMLSLGLGLTILLIQFGYSRYITAKSRLKQIDPWRDPLWRKEQIALSRQRERDLRVAVNSQKAKSYPSISSASIYNKEEYKTSKDLPLAE